MSTPDASCRAGRISFAPTPAPSRNPNDPFDMIHSLHSQLSRPPKRRRLPRRRYLAALPPSSDEAIALPNVLGKRAADAPSDGHAPATKKPAKADMESQVDVDVRGASSDTSINLAASSTTSEQHYPPGMSTPAPAEPGHAEADQIAPSSSLEPQAVDEDSIDVERQASAEEESGVLYQDTTKMDILHQIADVLSEKVDALTEKKVVLYRILDSMH